MVPAGGRIVDRWGTGGANELAGGKVGGFERKLEEGYRQGWRSV